MLYKMSFTTDFIALGWGKVKYDPLSLGVHDLASTGHIDY